MACNCGGRRGANAAAIASGNGIAAVWRLTHPNTSTVDYWVQSDAERAQKALIKKELEEAARTGRDPRPVLLEHVDSRTGKTLAS